MNRRLPISFLIFCFGLSSVNAALADQTVNASPVLVEPYDQDLQDISQQMLAQDRINRDEELAIRGLIDDNQKLTDTALARQSDSTLSQIHETLIKYRDFLINRDRLRIEANGRPRLSKYHDLIVLTEDVDNEKDAGKALELKNDVIRDKYTILTELKDELMALNEKLKSGAFQGNGVKDKIQILTQRLPVMDQKIDHYDQILAAKDQQIAELKSDVQQRDESISWLKQVLAAAKNKAEYYQLTSQENLDALRQAEKEMRKIEDDFTQRFQVYDEFEQAIIALKNRVRLFGGELSQKQEQVDLLKSELEKKITEANNDDRLKLAQRLVDLQQQQAALLAEKSRLREAQNVLYDQHVSYLEDKMKQTLASRQTQTMDLRARMAELKNELDQKEQQVELLKTELENKIVQEQNQDALAAEIRNLKAQLQDKENLVANMKAAIEAGQQTQAQTDVLKGQLADQQNRMDLLKQELQDKNTQSDQMTLMISEYQKKLESRNNAYNEQFKQMLASKNGQGQMDEQIADLNARLQQKEAQIVRIKKDLYDLQEAAGAKDLNISIMQQKMQGLKTQLALAGQPVAGVTSSDELEYLKTGLKQATSQLKQKDAMISQIKANADEYQKEFKAQSAQFKSLKDQLQNAYDQLDRRNEDLKYKKLELLRFKDQAAAKEGDLLDQVKTLTRRLEVAEKKLRGLPVSKEEAAMTEPAGNDALRKKLQQALDKLDEQGRLISVLAQKLQDAGQSVNLRNISKQ